MRAFHPPGMSLLTVRRHRVPGAAPEDEGGEARRGFHSVRAGFGSALVGLGGSMLFISTDACAAMAEPVRCMTSCLRRRISSSVRTSIARRTDRICLRVPHWNDEIDPEIRSSAASTLNPTPGTAPSSMFDSESSFRRHERTTVLYRFDACSIPSAASISSCVIVLPTSGSPKESESFRTSMAVGRPPKYALLISSPMCFAPLPCRALPCHAAPCRALPGRAAPRRARSCLAAY